MTEADKKLYQFLLEDQAKAVDNLNKVEPSLKSSFSRLFLKVARDIILEDIDRLKKFMKNGEIGNIEWTGSVADKIGSPVPKNLPPSDQGFLDSYSKQIKTALTEMDKYKGLSPVADKYAADLHPILDKDAKYIGGVK